MKRLVLAVGDANVDLIARITLFPKKGGEVLLEQLERRAGGSAANLSVAISRLGLSSGFIGRVGDDSFGHFLIDEFEREKVDVDQLQVDREIGTGLTFILVTEDGERTMFGFRGANVYLSADEIDMGYVQNADVLHISGYSFLRNPQRESALKILDGAKRAGTFISFDAGILPTMKVANRLRRVLRSVDLLFLNETEAKLLMGVKNPENAARRALKIGPKIVVLKLGERGCLILTEGEEIHSPAFDVKVVDTTGAGDAFDAGFLVGVVKRWDNTRTARFANAAGALSATKVGARAALPTMGEVKGFLRRSRAGN